MPARKNGPNRTLDILSSIAEEDFLGADVAQNLRDNGLRVERIALALIRPDGAQEQLPSCPKDLPQKDKP